jgi:DNA-binding transcriptional MerR regulator
MTINSNDLLNSILESISRIDYVKSADIPNIDLYMDQVTSFMEKQLKSTKRYDEDKILTKTMINNYAKNDLLPAPVKKKYSKEHLLLLTFIYYFKNILSMKDIEMLLKPITEKYFHTDSEMDIAHIYDEVCAFELERTKLLQKDIEQMYNNSMETFADAPEEDRDSLQFFSFICSLSLDVYVKKLLIEKLIDTMPTPAEKETKKEK